MKKSRLAAAALRSIGWAWEGDLPTEKKWICLAYPHTSNWDGALMLLVSRAIGLDMRFMIKADWVKGPMGPVMRGFGAVPIDRSKANNVVDQMIDEFRTSDHLALMIPPEGTRGLTEGWKSGFYHIARGANVPVVPGYLDYKRKRAGMGPPRLMTGNVKEDMDGLRAYYDKMRPTAQTPADMGPIRLRDEG